MFLLSHRIKIKSAFCRQKTRDRQDSHFQAVGNEICGRQNYRPECFAIEQSKPGGSFRSVSSAGSADAHFVSWWAGGRYDTTCCLQSHSQNSYSLLRSLLYSNRERRPNLGRTKFIGQNLIGFCPTQRLSALIICVATNRPRSIPGRNCRTFD